MARSLCIALLVSWLPALLQPAGARAQEADPEQEASPGVAFEEEPDPTRLDVERLPPEAVEIDRDLFARGLFVEAQLGAEGFVTGLGEVSAPGPRLGVLVGYEFAVWLAIAARLEGSLHETTNRAPPSATVSPHRRAWLRTESMGAHSPSSRTAASQRTADGPW